MGALALEATLKNPRALPLLHGNTYEDFGNPWKPYTKEL